MSGRKTRRGEPFSCLRVDVEARAVPDPAERQAAADWIGAECFGAGAAGVEERSSALAVSLFIYAADSVLEEVRTAAQAAGGVIAGPAEPVEDADWSQSWKVGLEAIEVSDRLVVRPSFVAFEPRAGQRELIIDPGQAFGTGGHASTSLVLEWVDVLSRDFTPQTRVLDVGTGTGVLALAALALGAGRAVGFDLDPLAAIEARAWAQENGLADRFEVFAGGIEALAAAPFDLVLANLLRRELLPIVSELARCTRSGGQIVLSGLLAAEGHKVEEVMAPFGFETRGDRTVEDATGDQWVSLLMLRA